MLSDQEIIELLDTEIKTGPYAHITFKEKFWNQVDIKNFDECWEFSKKIYKNGYGCFRINGNDILAHKISWIINNGIRKTGLVIMHSCDNRKCVNPNHLSMGTNQDNILDMINKNRQNIPLGENNFRCKLSKKDIYEIKILKMDGISAMELSKIFNVSRPQIYRILNGTRRNKE